MSESFDDLILAVRRRRDDAIAQHAAELALLDGIEEMLFEAAALRDPPPPEPIAEITWTEVWQNHPAAADFFAQFPDGFPEDRMMQS